MAAAQALGCARLPDSSLRARTGPFRHGVASGDPLSDAVILWTRVTVEANGDPRPAVIWEMSFEPTFERIERQGTALAEIERDHTVKVDATGLAPGATYFYRFRIGEISSPIGRTKTAPLVATNLRFAVASCSSLAHGYFWAYAAIAERADIDAVIHVGDYLYEYGEDEYGDERPSYPTHELRVLGDYRARYAQYRSDVDLQEMHRQHPMIATWDDHEVCDNAHRDMCGEHSADEGSYADRKRAAFRAYSEWMPIRDGADLAKVWRSLRYGNLAEIFMLDTRHWAKAAQAGDQDYATIFGPNRDLLGRDQEAWLYDGLQRSTSQWKLVCQQVMMAALPQYRNTDQWDGYPMARERFLDAIENVDDVVIVSGDIHASFANDIARRPMEPGAYDAATGRGASCVEIVTPSITSPSPSEPDSGVQLERENPWMKWAQLTEHGYVLLDLTRDRAQAAFFYVEDVESRNGQAAEFRAALSTRAGTSCLLPDPAGPAVASSQVIPLAPGPVNPQSASRRVLPETKPIIDVAKFGERIR